jgi:hypothetical protein
LRSALKRVAALAGLNFFEGLDQVVALSLSEAGERRLLSLEAQA